MESCKMIDDTVPTLNLFKQKRVKGWWPFETEDGECAVSLKRSCHHGSLITAFNFVLTESLFYYNGLFLLKKAENFIRE